MRKVVGGATTYYAGSHYEKTVFSAITATPLNNGVACQDGATGTGYIMYSEESAHALLMNTVASRNFVKTDWYGNKVFSRILEDGTEAWVYVRDGVIRNGGINPTPIRH